MTPLKTLISVLSLFIVLGIIAFVYPPDGIKVADVTFRYPKLTDIFEKKALNSDDSAGITDPEDAIREMMDATKRKEFAAFSDSLKFYEDFFKKGRTRFDLPNNDPTWFDRFFLHLQSSQVSTTPLQASTAVLPC